MNRLHQLLTESCCNIKNQFLLERYLLLARFAIVILGMPLAFSFEKRAFIFGLVVSALILWLVTRVVSKSVIIGSISLISFLLFILTFLFKLDSTLGRLLIYKISFPIFKEHWLFGIGMGKFKQVYLFQQAAYFAQGTHTNKELLLADNTYYVFNDYWQFILENGMIGVIGLIALGYLLVKLISTTIKSNRNTVVNSNILLLLIMLIITAFFTSIFTKVIFQFIVVLCVLLLIIINGLQKRIFIVLILSLLLLNIMSKGIENYNIKKNYRNALNLYIAGLMEDCDTELRKIYPIKDNKRSVLYLQVLLSTFDIHKEQQILQLLKEHPHSHTYKLLGDYYIANHQFIKAEEAYLLSINMVPNRFVPRQSLLRLYVFQNKISEAIKVSKDILSLSVKVNSYQVEVIKLEATNFLRNQRQTK